MEKRTPIYFLSKDVPVTPVLSASNPALSAGHPFLNVSNRVYWTSTSCFGGETGSPKAWTIRIGDGRIMNDSSSNVKASAASGVWAAKGNGGGTVDLAATGTYVGYAAGDDGSLWTGVPFPYLRFIANGTVTDAVFSCDYGVYDVSKANPGCTLAVR